MSDQVTAIRLSLGLFSHRASLNVTGEHSCELTFVFKVNEPETHRGQVSCGVPLHPTYTSRRICFVLHHVARTSLKSPMKRTLCEQTKSCPTCAHKGQDFVCSCCSDSIRPRKSRVSPAAISLGFTTSTLLCRWRRSCSRHSTSWWRAPSSCWARGSRCRTRASCT